MAVTRNYSYKNVDMLIGARTVAENFVSHKDDFVLVRPAWADPFIQTYNERIDNAIETYLGLDPKKDLKAATQAVTEMQDKSYKDLAILKVQIEADFSTDKQRLEKILTNLGYSKKFSTVKKDQQALIQMLYTFKKGMTTNLESELTAKGINPALINTIKGYAETLKANNVTQESLKGTTKKLTAAGTAELNEIYSQAIAICKLASKIFSADPISKKMFSFSQIISNMLKQKSSNSDTGDTDSSDLAA